MMRGFLKLTFAKSLHIVGWIFLVISIFSSFTFMPLDLIL